MRKWKGQESENATPNQGGLGHYGDAESSLRPVQRQGCQFIDPHSYAPDYQQTSMETKENQTKKTAMIN